MKKEDFRKLALSIVSNLDKPEEVTRVLTTLTETYDNESTKWEDFDTKTKDYEGKITKLREDNMNLFLKVGNPVTSQKLNTDKPLSYEDLFNDKGELK